MEKINLGRIEVVFGEPSLSSDTSQEMRTQAMSLADAEKLAGFKIRQPTYFPSANLNLIETLVAIVPESQKVMAIVLKYKDASGRWMVLEQLPINLEEQEQQAKMVVPFPVRRAEVKDKAAAFFSHTVNAKNQPNGQVNITHGLWEHENFLMELQGPWSTQDLIQVGASLG